MEDIAAAKAKLSELVQRALDGEDVILARNGVPAVRLVPVYPVEDVSNDPCRIIPELKATLKKGALDPLDAADWGSLNGLENRMILLDTCTLLWLDSDPAKLSESVKESLRRTPVGQRYVATISALEIGIKHAQKKLALPLQSTLWFERQCSVRGVIALPLTVRIATRAAALPPHHRDPADRVIIATAREHGLTVLTPDHAFSNYDVPFIW